MSAGLPATQSLNVSWSICDSAPGGCGIWISTNHTIANYDGLWAWGGNGPPTCTHYSSWWALYNQDGCYFPWGVGGAWQQQSYLLSRDQFDMRFGVNFFGQLIIVGPYYHNAYINFYPDGFYQVGSN